MSSKPLGVIAALLASFAVILLGLTVALSLPMWVMISMIIFSVLVLAAAGAFIGMAVSAQRNAAAGGPTATGDAPGAPDETR